MTELPGNNSDFGSGNREDDGPEPDVESSTEEGAGIIQRSEASIDRDARDRQQAIGATYGGIPIVLYDKAVVHQDQLTEPERQWFLNRGDVVAKALGSPSLTAEEIHQACGWPPPDVVRANIQHATGGRLSTPAELFAKVKDARENGQFDIAVSDEEACLIVHSFYAREKWLGGRCSESHGLPGYGYAYTLLTRRLGQDIASFEACGYRAFKVQGLPKYSSQQTSATTSMTAQDESRLQRIASGLSNAINSAEEQARQGAITDQEFLAIIRIIQADKSALNPSGLLISRHYRPLPNTPFQLIPPGVPHPSVTDYGGSSPWPASSRSVGAFYLFHEDTGFSGPDSACRAVPLWAMLLENQRDAYRARAEAKRREAWADYETRLARKDANPNPAFPPSAFELFRNEQVAGIDGGGVGFGEVVARWEALTPAQRGLYDQQVWQAERAGRPAVQRAAERAAQRAG
jgi:hypothetical protein